MIKPNEGDKALDAPERIWIDGFHYWKTRKSATDAEYIRVGSSQGFEAWWESQGLDGEQVKAHEYDRWALAQMAFNAGRADLDSDWQPIESAPKDGTRMLVYQSDGRMALGYWHDDLREFPDRHESADECEREHCGRNHERRLLTWVTDGVTSVQPTYWRPLPPPPFASKP